MWFASLTQIAPTEQFRKRLDVIYKKWEFLERQFLILVRNLPKKEAGEKKTIPFLKILFGVP